MIPISSELLADTPTGIGDWIIYEWTEATLDQRDGPRLGPGRAEWRRTLTRKIVTVRHGHHPTT